MMINDAISKMSLSELKMLANMFDASDHTVIFNDDNFRIRMPQNCYDTNYSVYDKNNNITYLVDMFDIDHIDDYTPEELIDLSWKIL